MEKMNHLLDIFSFFGFFMLGVLLAIWIKIADINAMKQELTFKTAMKLFIQKEYKSYGFSVTFAIGYAFAHDEWIKLLTTTNITPDKIVELLGALPMIASIVFGFVIQYGIYKIWLGKLDKLFRQQQQDISNNKN